MGVLYLREGTKIIPQQSGGAQESYRRAGTENVAGIVGMATALRLASENKNSNSEHCKRLRDRIIRGIESGIGETRLNGHPTQRLPNNVSMSFRYVEGESILLNLDLKGIAASSGSACATGEEDPSHVLLAIGAPSDMVHSTVRFTVGPANTDDDVEYLLGILPGIVERLREMSPLAALSKENGESDV
jgi:cysteine desulfurase